ncbi:MAG TPA: hypothetical protein DIT07_06980 [Sphingobacteriaceae bacterium]|nr:hypothetical protein [Sphingobacteriaceae bacterium]
MGKLYSLLFRTTLFLIAFAFNQSTVIAMAKHGVTDTTKAKTGKIIDTRPNKPAAFPVKIKKAEFLPFRPISLNNYNNIAGSNGAQDPDDDMTLNVKVYPIPVADQLNVSYHLNKDSNVIIEIMDFLGKKISTLLSQRMPAGEQNNSFSVVSKLKSGFYFVRIKVGDQKTVTKRISVL